MMKPSLVRFALASSLAALAATPLLLGACGGAEKPAEAPAAPAASAPAGTSDAAAAAAPSPAASGAPAEPASAAPAPPPAAPKSTKATVKNDPAWAACHQTYKGTGKDVSKDLAAMAKGCAAATKLKPVGKVFTGKQADQQPPQSFPLKAKASHCYRVYGYASDGIKDLDVALKDSAGVVAGEDSTDDPSPVVLEDGAVCFTADDDATVVVSVGMGSGNYAVQVWGD